MDGIGIISVASSEQGQWVEESCVALARWKDPLTNIYVDWSVLTNGLHVCAERYDDPGWAASRGGFSIRALRNIEERRTDWIEIVQWEGPEAAEAHRQATPKIATWGFVDYYAAFERLVFDLYTIWHNHHPVHLCRGPENKELRRLQRNAINSPEDEAAWVQAWEDRLGAWRRKKIYGGLGAVLQSYMTVSGLQAPKTYKQSTVDQWVEIVDNVGLLRHALVHGADTVPDEVADFCTKPYSLALGFQKGDALALEFRHFAAIELFSKQLLAALNLSLVEHPDAGK